MPTDIDLAYCAGLIDGEGCIRVKRCKPYKHLTGRVSPSFDIAIQVRMVDRTSIDFLEKTLGGWSWAEKPNPNKKRRPLFCWQATASVAEDILAALLPFLKLKKPQAENALNLRQLLKNSVRYRTKVTGYRNFPNKYGTPRRVENRALSEEFIVLCQSHFDRSRELNRVGV